MIWNPGLGLSPAGAAERRPPARGAQVEIQAEPASSLASASNAPDGQLAGGWPALSQVEMADPPEHAQVAAGRAIPHPPLQHGEVYQPQRRQHQAVLQEADHGQALLDSGAV